MPTIVALLSQKGGVGKSTLATHLASYATDSGRKALLIDLDSQASAVLWADRRGDKAPDVTSVHAARLGQTLDAAKAQGYEVIVIDTAPHQDQAALVAAKAADQIVIPIKPSLYDLAALKATLDLCQIARKPATVVLNMAPIRGRTIDEAVEDIKRSGGTVCPIVIRQRMGFQHSAILGQTVGEYERGSPAALEIEALGKAILFRAIPAKRSRKAAA